MDEMVCPRCKKAQTPKVGEHHYVESGLTNVWLRGVEILQCACGEETVSIPRILELHKVIGKTLLEQGNQLSGQEIRFLRKHMGIKALDFAARLGVDKATLSRWENDKEKPSELADRLIRLVYAAHMGLAAIAKKLAKETFLHINPQQTETPIYLPVPQKHPASFSAKRRA